MENIILAVITVLGSGVVWSYLEKRAKERASQNDFIRVNCEQRITKLEDLLREASEEKNELREQVLVLSKLVAELQTRVEFFEREKKALRKAQ
jgi:phage shock protein A